VSVGHRRWNANVSSSLLDRFLNIRSKKGSASPGYSTGYFPEWQVTTVTKTLQHRKRTSRRSPGTRQRHFAGTSLKPHKLPDGPKGVHAARCVGRCFANAIILHQLVDLYSFLLVLQAVSQTQQKSAQTENLVSEHTRQDNPLHG
jgi:hypothetical protein